ncbi:MAG: hypothetical protein E5V75_33635 [Mesorhizobium sp.]|nr:MAG: hypothetical protein E5V75_33635 [Mesorhizobium sp.]
MEAELKSARDGHRDARQQDVELTRLQRCLAGRARAGISTEAVEMQVAMTAPAPKRKSRARIRPGKKKDQTFRGNSPESLGGNH